MSEQDAIMEAIVCTSPGGPEVLKLSTTAKPKPAPGQLLVQVAATALNRADLLQREGKYPAPTGASEILGLEIAGTIVGMGVDCQRFALGEEVFGLIPGGGYAAFAVIDEEMAVAKPAHLSFEQAAAIPEVYLTAFQALKWIGELRAGQTVLIHAGASGVGTAAIQIAKICGATVIVTASKEKHALCMQLGADNAIDYKAGPFEHEVMMITQSLGVDIVLDFIGGPYWHQNIACLKLDGTLVLLASMGGGKVNDFDLRSILVKRLKVHGSTLRSRALAYQTKLTEEFSAFGMELFEHGRLQPVVDKIFNWKHAAEAHTYMEANKNAGKIILKIQ